nr:MAG TPA: terminase small subunit [Caudoviricetes sp.]
MSKFKDWLEGDGLLKLEGWARDGLTDEQISRNMGIAYSTFREWKKKYSAFSAVLKRTKDIVDREVENALFKRAMGYKYDEVTYERGEEVKRVTKEVAPDTTAQIFWLKNRKPAEWRDKIEQQQTVTIQDDGFLEALKGTIKDDWDETS